MQKEGACKRAPSCDSNCLQLDVSGDTVKASELVIQTKGKITVQEIASLADWFASCLLVWFEAIVGLSVDRC